LVSALAQAIAGIAPGRLRAASPTTLPIGSANRQFAIFYQGDRIGTHTVRSAPSTGGSRVNTEVQITVKRLMFTVFSYRHSSQETWQGGRLTALASVTTQDAQTFRVDGAAMQRGFRVVGQAGPFIAPAATLTSNCLWSLLILQQETVIDAQHGGVIGLSVRKLADAEITMAGRPLTVSTFRLVTPELAGTMWYDGSGSWVGGELERRGAKLAYRLES
jgi:hypothetical protein